MIASFRFALASNRGRAFAIIMLLCGMAGGAALADPSVIYVDAENGNDLYFGNSWTLAKKTLQVAIDTAAMNGVPQVWVKAGTYSEARPTSNGSLFMRSGVALYGGFAGGETDLSQSDPLFNTTTIDGATANAGAASRHVVVMDGITTARIDGFTVTGGYSPNPSSTENARGAGIFCRDLYSNACEIARCNISTNSMEGRVPPTEAGGAGICCLNSSPGITSCVISGNTGIYGCYGGGIYCDTSSPTIQDCVISGNYAGGGYMYSSAGGDGGGIYCTASAPEILRCVIIGNYSKNNGAGIGCNYSQAVIADCYISSNSSGLNGGAISCWQSSATILNSALNGNEVIGEGSGGGIYCDSSNLTVINCGISSNATQARKSRYYNGYSGGDGGGISIYYGSVLSCQDCIISSNVASGGFYSNGQVGGNGAGVYCEYQSAASFDGCAIQGNLSSGGGDGGGINANASSLTILNSEISGNSSSAGNPLGVQGGRGAGIFLYGAPLSIIDNCAILNNSTHNVADGGGIYCESSASSITNCVISGNSAASLGSGGGICCNQSSPAILNCVISGNSVRAGMIPAAYYGEGLGAGIYCSGLAPVIAGCRITGNFALNGGFGGGIACNLSAAEIRNCIIDANVAQVGDHSGPIGGGGGGIYAFQSSPIITNCVITGNPAYKGGGINLADTNTGRLTNCIISGNSAVSQGGAGVLQTRDTSVILNCTISGNTAPSAGGMLIADNSSPVFTNTIFTSNSQCAIYEGVGICDPALTNCLFFGNPDGDYFNGDSVTTLTGVPLINDLINYTGQKNSGNVGGDPKFVMDYRLGAGSAAIDAGTSATAPVTDIAGTTRPIDIPGVGTSGTNAFDIGAYEAPLNYAAPKAPSNPSGLAVAPDSIAWGWQDNSDDEDGFRVFCGLGSVAPESASAADLAANTTSWTASGLLTNTQYSFQALAYSSSSGASDRTANLSRYTLAVAPAAPFVGDPTAAWLDVAIRAGDGNPANTEYAIYCETAAQWALRSGGMAATPTWLTASEWSTTTLRGLAENTSYTFSVRARNGDGVETANGPSATAATLVRQYHLGVIVLVGTATVTPPGNIYSPGTTVTVTAIPGAGYHFERWGGDVPAGHETDNPLTLVMNGDKILGPSILRDMGTVVVFAKPSSAAWTLTDADGGITTGTGAAMLSNIPAGVVIAQWAPLGGFELPLSNPTRQTLSRDAILTMEGRYTLPVSLMSDLLLGHLANPTREQIEAADVNQDGVISLADLMALIAAGR